MHLEEIDHLVLYDGECGFCNFWVQWILKSDRQQKFRFASLQGNFGQNFLSKYGMPADNFDTVYFLKDGKRFTKLDAVAKIGTALGGIYRLLAALQFFPSFIKNPLYKLIARNRKKIAGARCLLPTPQEKLQFIR